jgi:hypothetical protein
MAIADRLRGFSQYDYAHPRNRTEEYMSFQAYLDNIKAKTGKHPRLRQTCGQEGPDDARRNCGMAEERLRTRARARHRDRRSAVEVGRLQGQPRTEDRRALLGQKDGMAKGVRQPHRPDHKIGPDVVVEANETYVNLLRSTKKFGILQPSSADRLDIGIKRKGKDSGSRFETAGRWNSMVTHRVRVANPKEIDAEVLSWLKSAYKAA